MANELTISGRIVSVLPLQTGTSKSGHSWQKQEYILDTGGQYPKKVCFSLFGDSITKFPLQVGQDVTVSIDIESREWNNKWYTEVRAWNVTYASQQPQLQAQPPVAQPVPPQPQPAPQPQATGELPF
ncbi:DUF3127 domain-containing protein [Porphyromonas sp.]